MALIWIEGLALLDPQRFEHRWAYRPRRPRSRRQPISKQVSSPARGETPGEITAQLNGYVPSSQRCVRATILVLDREAYAVLPDVSVSSVSPTCSNLSIAAGNVSAAPTSDTRAYVNFSADAGYPPELAHLHSIRDQYEADLVSLLVLNGPSSACGIGAGRPCGRAVTSRRIGQVSEFPGSAWWDFRFRHNGFSIAHIPAAINGHPFTHEVGHTLGAHHDVYTFNVDGTDPTADPFARDGSGLGAGVRSVMAYDRICVLVGVPCAPTAILESLHDVRQPTDGHRRSLFTLLATPRSGRQHAGHQPDGLDGRQLPLVSWSRSSLQKSVCGVEFARRSADQPT